MAEGSSVHVYFFGICTHMGPRGTPEDPVDWGHRVVLVNASDPKRWAGEPALKGVGAHVATLQLTRANITGPLSARPWFPITYADDSIVEWSLRGVTLTVADSVGTTREAEVGSCIPHLKEHCDHLPPVGRAAFGRDPAETACFFDFPDSPFRGEIERHGASVGVLRVSTSGSPFPHGREKHGPVLLHVTAFEANQEPLSIALRDGASITVSNIPEDRTADKEKDFYLHFLTASTFPRHGLSVPKMIGSRCPDLQLDDPNDLPRNLGDYTGPGCSNSTYP